MMMMIAVKVGILVTGPLFSRDQTYLRPPLDSRGFLTCGQGVKLCRRRKKMCGVFFYKKLPPSSPFSFLLLFLKMLYDATLIAVYIFSFAYFHESTTQRERFFKSLFKKIECDEIGFWFDKLLQIMKKGLVGFIKKSLMKNTLYRNKRFTLNEIFHISKRFKICCILCAYNLGFFIFHFTFPPL